MTPRMKDAADHVSVTSREEPVHSRPHVVLASDFSSGPDAADVRFWSGRQSLGGISVCYRDAWESIHPDEAGCTMLLRNPLTGAGAWPPRRIDYVMVRCPERGGGPTLSIKRCELAFDQPVGEVWASDHFGVVADLAALEGAERP